jgi:carbon monoxide dehydrogenase subunit G/peroxiredoxin
MKFQHRCVLPGAPERLWDFLMNIPEVGKCVAGAGEIQATDGNAYNGTMRVKIGPIRLNLRGTITLEEARREVWQAKFRSEARDMGLAGAVRASVTMKLLPQGPESTELVVDTDAVFMGKLGEFGYPLIRKKADEIMRDFSEKVVQRHMNDEARAYNTPGFSLKLPDIQRLGDTLPARTGAPAPDFEAPTVDGREVRLKDLIGHRHVVLMTGSITSPMCAIAVPAMNRLHAQFDPRGVDFYLLYTKESHPGENYPHHASLEQKFAHALDLRRLENVQFPILVDGIEGRIHRKYGPWPTAAFVIRRDGRLVYRSTIVNPTELECYLEELLASDALDADPDRIPHIGYSEQIVEHPADQATHRRVYERAGPKAFEDYWKVFPALRNRWP